MCLLCSADEREKPRVLVMFVGELKFVRNIARYVVHSSVESIHFVNFGASDVET